MSETAGLVGCSQSASVDTYGERSEEGKTTNCQQMSGGLNLSVQDVRHPEPVVWP